MIRDSTEKRLLRGLSLRQSLSRACRGAQDIASGRVPHPGTGAGAFFRRVIREHRIPLLLLALSLVHGVLYAAVVPPWQAPDEPRHFERVRLTYEKGRDVSGADLSLSLERGIIASMDRFNFWHSGRLLRPQFQPGTLPESFNDIWFSGRPYDPDQPNLTHQFHQPPLYYLTVGMLLRVVGIHDLLLQLYVSRLLSVILAALVVLVAYLVVRELFPTARDLQIAVPAFIALLPMHTFVTSAVLNDVLAELLASVLIYLLAMMFARGLTVSRVGLILSVLFLGRFTKRTFLFALPLTLFAMMVMGALRFTKRETWVKIGIATAVVIPIIGGLGWWLRATLITWGQQQVQAYFGDVRVVGILEEFVSHTDRYIWSPFKSFWGWFGWMRVELDPVWYLILLLLCLVAGLGVLRFVWRNLRGDADIRPWQGAILLVYVVAVALVGLSSTFTTVVGSLVSIWTNFTPQGRYLFPVIVPIAILFTLGLREWVPPDHRRAWLIAILGFFLAFDVVALIGYIVPYFYG